MCVHTRVCVSECAPRACVRVHVRMCTCACLCVCVCERIHIFCNAQIVAAESRDVTPRGNTGKIRHELRYEHTADLLQHPWQHTLQHTLQHTATHTAKSRHASRHEHNSSDPHQFSQKPGVGGAGPRSPVDTIFLRRPG